MTARAPTKHLQFRPRKNEPDLAAWVNRVLEDGTHREKLAAAIRFYVQQGEPAVLPPPGTYSAPKAPTSGLEDAIPEIVRQIVGELKPFLVGAGPTLTDVGLGVNQASAAKVTPPTDAPSAASRLKDRFRRSSGMDDADEEEE